MEFPQLRLCANLLGGGSAVKGGIGGGSGVAGAQGKGARRPSGRYGGLCRQFDPPAAGGDADRCCEIHCRVFES